MLVPMIEVSDRSPSMPMTAMPASLASCSGGIIASGSVTEIMIAFGFWPISALTMADCLATSNSGAPWYVKSMPSSSARAWAPQATVL